jgi:hypothetical protein
MVIAPRRSLSRHPPHRNAITATPARGGLYVVRRVANQQGVRGPRLRLLQRRVHDVRIGFRFLRIITRRRFVQEIARAGDPQQGFELVALRGAGGDSRETAP